jgi:hypothetical protein
LKEGEFARKCAAMTRYFDMDDRARLPWRFHAQALSLRLRG